MSVLITKLRAMDAVLSVKEVAALMRISHDVIYGLVEKNGIPYFRIGKTLRFDPETLANWLERKAMVGVKTGAKLFISEY